ncbi:MAG: hypothetical protein A2992_07175 [Elusimicrobia bacterium RIFCSPLOWO2_01_FULL_59_12]|nr:MAG: hypothetical protein A2992_07175 [Elusimicrobia bacterium RIFCSPLOWO2_01_FULL_59_12]
MQPAKSSIGPLRPPALAVLLALTAISACRRDPIETYRVSKEIPRSPSHAAAPAPQEVTWRTPAGWEEQAPSAMRAGSFLVKGPGGRTADVSVIPLAGTAGGDLANINRWRGQIDLDPLSQEELARFSQSITPSGRSMRWVDFEHGGKRLVAAIHARKGRTWFFKMTGDDRTVQDAEPAFRQFLESLRFYDGPQR